MKRERDKGNLNGIKIFRDLCRDYLDASKEGKVALGQRIVKPSRAEMDTFEDRLRAWEEDVERLDRITAPQAVDEPEARVLGGSYASRAERSVWLGEAYAARVFGIGPVVRQDDFGA